MWNNCKGLIIIVGCMKVLRARMVNEIHVHILAIMFIGNYSCGIIVRV